MRIAPGAIQSELSLLLSGGPPAAGLCCSEGHRFVCRPLACLFLWPVGNMLSDFTGDPEGLPTIVGIQ